MASEPTEGGTVSGSLPEDLEAWLDERADELGLEREELFQQLLSAYQVAATAGEGEFAPSGQTARLEQRLERLEDDYRESLEDVRKRVVQVKKVAESRAAADHDHDAFDRIDDLDERVTALAERVDAIDRRVDQRSGGDPPAEGELDDLQRKLSTVARALVSLRREVDAMEPSESGDTAASDSTPASTDTGMSSEATDRLLELKRTAAREGYETATCGACGESAHVNLLPEPACPSCGTPVHEIVDRGGLRSKPTLVGKGGDGE